MQVHLHLSGLYFQGPLNCVEAPTPSSAGHPIAKCRRHRFRAFRTLFGGRGNETGTEIGTTDDPSIALDIRFASDT